MIKKMEVKNEITIEVSDFEIEKIRKVIKKIEQKINLPYENVKKEEMEDINSYDFNRLKKSTIEHKKIVHFVLNEVINEYKEELKDLEVVFLACSFGRDTNKINSDLDLHFIYKNNDYDYCYEEIVCYIITTILKKTRDDIDPKLTINFDKSLKKEYEKMMDDKDLKIALRSNNFKIEYNYRYNKKKKFFLQYNNSKTLKDLQDYIYNNGIIFINQPWAHSFDIIFGKENFEKMYKTIYNKEKKLITYEYIYFQIELLIANFNNFKFNNEKKYISSIKKEYQSEIFTLFYKFLNILRLYYISLGNEIKYLSIYSLYDIVETRDKKIVNQILEYIWEIRKMSNFCNLNNVNYSLHANDIFEGYDLNKIQLKYEKIQKSIKKKLEEMKENE